METICREAAGEECAVFFFSDRGNLSMFAGKGELIRLFSYVLSGFV